MEYSKKTRIADTILSIVVVIALIYTVYDITALTFGLEEELGFFMIPIGIIDDFVPLIVGTLLLGAYDMFVNSGKKTEIDKRKQDVINAENSHQNKLKGMTLFTSALISLLVKLYQINPFIIFILIFAYIVCIIVVVPIVKFGKYLFRKKCN